MILIEWYWKSSESYLLNMALAHYVPDEIVSEGINGGRGGIEFYDSVRNLKKDDHVEEIIALVVISGGDLVPRHHSRLR
jgi:hypothetical protein